MSQARIEIPQEAIAAFCQKWRVREFSLFSSVLRDDFRPDSDIDVLVGFEPDSGIGLWEMTDMRNELAVLFGREVDLVAKDGLRNPFRRESTLGSCEQIYAT
jgi:predicted nucleotidyltransferase